MDDSYKLHYENEVRLARSAGFPSCGGHDFFIYILIGTVILYNTLPVPHMSDTHEDDTCKQTISNLRSAPRDRTEMQLTDLQRDVFGRVVSYLSPIDMASLLMTSRGDDLWTQAIEDTLIARAKQFNRLQWLYDHGARASA